MYSYCVHQKVANPRGDAADGVRQEDGQGDPRIHTIALTSRSLKDLRALRLKKQRLGRGPFSEPFLIFTRDAIIITYAIRTTPNGPKMHRKLTLSIDEEVHYGLYAVIGPRRISRFIEKLIRPPVTHRGLDAAYRQMALDQARAAEALEWAEATVGDVRDQ